MANNTSHNKSREQRPLKNAHTLTMLGRRGSYHQHQVGLVEVDGTGGPASGLQTADFEVHEVIGWLRASGQGVQAAQDAV